MIPKDSQGQLISSAIDGESEKQIAKEKLIFLVGTTIQGNSSGSAELAPEMNKSKDKTCAITINPTINLRDAQRQDENISKVIDCKLNNRPKPDFAEWKDDLILRNVWSIMIVCLFARIYLCALET